MLAGDVTPKAMQVSEILGASSEHATTPAQTDPSQQCDARAVDRLEREHSDDDPFDPRSR